MFMHQLSYCFCVLASCKERLYHGEFRVQLHIPGTKMYLPNFRYFVCTGGANAVKRKKCETKCEQCEKYLGCL